MLAEKRKLFAMRISSLSLSLGVAAALMALGVVGAEAGRTKFQSPDEAFRKGISAYNTGAYATAIDALESAPNMFLAQYYLARIYADNNSAFTDHGKAYMLYQRIADEYADVDPDDDQRAPFVAKALTALAAYVRTGLPEIGLKADPERAAEYLRHASVVFDDEDAQFELAKLLLKGDGVETDEAMAKHWLSVLSQKGHAGAQAFLADLYWRGKHMAPDPVRALALITVAAENAPPSERVWIEDIYQNIFCDAPSGTRQQATGLVAEWGGRYGRKPAVRDRLGLGELGTPMRTCGDGEPALPVRTKSLRTPETPSFTQVPADIGSGFRDAGEHR